MSISMLESKIKRIQRELQQLENQRANALKDESNSLKKINRANQQISSSKNISTIRNKEREIQRENEKLRKAKEKQSSVLSKITRKYSELNKAISDLEKTRQKEQKKIYKEQEEKINKLKMQQTQEIKKVSFNLSNRLQTDVVKEYDVFISHSADDKDSFVNLLADALKEAGISIWYDRDNIAWGKSIRQEIDKGLAHSKYGIVVISPSFIEKYWTNYELDGILSKEGSNNTQMILPIWHNITADQVKKYSYSLSNILALNTGLNTLEEIVENVKKLLE